MIEINEDNKPLNFNNGSSIINDDINDEKSTKSFEKLKQIQALIKKESILKELCKIIIFINIE